LKEFSLDEISAITDRKPAESRGNQFAGRAKSCAIPFAVNNPFKEPAASNKQGQISWSVLMISREDLREPCPI